MDERRRRLLVECGKMAARRGGACLSATYVDSQSKLRWRCDEGHEWQATPNSIQQGHWCAACAGVQSLGIREMRAMAAERGGECLSTKYVNVREPLRWRCAEGHEWEAPANRVRHAATWCQICSSRSTRTLDDLRALAAPFGGTCLAREVTTIHGDYRWQCRLGHVFTTSAHQVQQGHWCGRCRGRGQDDLTRMKRLARRRGGSCISDEYVNATTKLWWRCREGHEWDALPGSIVQGSWCPSCAHVGTSTAPLSIEIMRELARARGGECLSNQYDNVKSRLWWRCALGHEWEAIAGNVRQRTWCPTCAHAYPGTIDGMRRLAVERGGQCLSTEYAGHRTLLLWECASGHRFEARGVAVKSGMWCPRGCKAAPRASRSV